MRRSPLTPRSNRRYIGLENPSAWRLTAADSLLSALPILLTFIINQSESEPHMGKTLNQKQSRFIKHSKQMFTCNLWLLYIATLIFFCDCYHNPNIFVLIKLKDLFPILSDGVEIKTIVRYSLPILFPCKGKLCTKDYNLIFSYRNNSR